MYFRSKTKIKLSWRLILAFCGLLLSMGYSKFDAFEQKESTSRYLEQQLPPHTPNESPR